MVFIRTTQLATRAVLVLFAGLVSAVMPATAGPNVTVLAFGLFGDQSVFESEARGAAGIVAARLGAKEVVVRANTKARREVTSASLGKDLQSAAEHMDRENDLLFLILTSHGSPDGVAVQAGKREETLSPGDLASMLNRAGVQRRIVVISACYSGVFIRPLANDTTLVMTAADASHSSFGCQDKVKWTYFGDAFFNTALRRAADLRTAFSTARTLISRREMRYGLPPSNPQIAGGENIDVQLRETARQDAAGRQR